MSRRGLIGACLVWLGLVAPGWGSPLLVFSWTQCGDDGSADFGPPSDQCQPGDPGAVFGVTNQSSDFTLLDIDIAVDVDGDGTVDSDLDLASFADDPPLLDGDLAPGTAGVFLFFPNVTGSLVTLTFGLSPDLPPGQVVTPGAVTLSPTNFVLEVSVETPSQVVPEPGTLLLLGGGLSGLGLRRRRGL